MARHLAAVLAVSLAAVTFPGCAADASAADTVGATTRTLVAESDRRVRSDLHKALAGWEECFRRALAGESGVDACRRDFHGYRESGRAILQRSPSPEWTALLLEVFRESINETLRERQFQLSRMQEREKTAEALSQYLAELADAARALNDQVASGGDEEARSRGQRRLNAEVELTRTTIVRFCREIGSRRCPAE